MRCPTLHPFEALFVLLALLIVSIAGCRNDGFSDNPKPAPKPARDANLKVDQALVAAANDFGFRLYNQLTAKDGSKNLFISPTSVELALAMTYNGARGDTQEGMAKALGIGDMKLEDFNKANASLMKVLGNPDPKVTLSIANSLWGRVGVNFSEDFLKRNTDFYGAKIASIDFSASDSADKINNWVKDNTGGMIKKLVEYNSIRDALMVLANAIYFKGKWSLPFDPIDTKPADFTLLDGTKKNFPMMENTDKFGYLETDQFQAIILPYGDKFVQCMVFLPKPEVKLADFMKNITGKQWEEWSKQFEQRKGTILLPRFRAEYSSSLKESLGKLGMGKAFSTDADLMGMISEADAGKLGGKPLITDVVHKTALEVDEEGTRAAAATGVIVGVTAMPMPETPFVMKVDRPFLLAICDRSTGANLFLGTIVSPEQLGAGS
jgi:serine protease inhibitor